MAEETILEEVWRVKDELAAKYNYDVRKMGRALMAAQKRGKRKVVSLKPKRAGAKSRG